MLSLGLLLSASCLLFLAHVVRSARWALLFPAGFLGQRFNLLLGLAAGYSINSIIPFRIGELVRALIVTWRDGTRFPYVCATVVVERVTDLVVVACILSVTERVQHPPASVFGSAIPLAIISAAAATALAFLIIRSLAVRKILWQAASIFNDKIAIEIADFFWSFAEILTSGSVLRWRYIGSTVAMWILYIASYYVFARAIQLPAVDVVFALLGGPLDSLIQRLPPGSPENSWIMLIFFVGSPILAILLYDKVRRGALANAFEIVRQHGKSGLGLPSSIHTSFKVSDTYELYLAKLFSGGDQLITRLQLPAIQDCIIHKFYVGGSDAVTALVEVEGRLIIRKFAADSAAEKLKVQADWLHAQQFCGLPLVSVSGDRSMPGMFSYDMPLITPANDFYDVIHTSATTQSGALLLRIVEDVATFHKATLKGDADPSLISAYLDTKITQNARSVEKFARRLIGSDAFGINGARYNFAQWQRLYDPDWLYSQIRDRRNSMVHGDLTIENIIVAPDERAGFYIIDPNPDNIFNSPLIDWAKLMQSLHLGYETLNRGLSCALSDGHIKLSSARSDVYRDLHILLENELLARFGEDTLREIYFHEIANYLRLIPYKMRRDPMRGLGFFACANILLARYVNRWEVQYERSAAS
jgi:uncharacterized protein (TIRG00374 family)